MPPELREQMTDILRRGQFCIGLCVVLFQKAAKASTDFQPLGVARSTLAGI
jgi:hypothetical protein